jgi:hypothetical protein
MVEGVILIRGFWEPCRIVSSKFESPTPINLLMLARRPKPKNEKEKKYLEVVCRHFTPFVVSAET